MIWLAWRQSRAQTMIALAAVLAVAAAAFASGRTDTTLRVWLSLLAVVGPGLLGVFWGAPLVAGELEARWNKALARVAEVEGKIAAHEAAEVAPATTVTVAGSVTAGLGHDRLTTTVLPFVVA